MFDLIYKNSGHEGLDAVHATPEQSFAWLRSRMQDLDIDLPLVLLPFSC